MASKQNALAEVLRVGNLMSNACYNLAQPSRSFDGGMRDTMASLYPKWDAALSAYRALCEPKKRPAKGRKK